jgi:hypothetical protein
MKEFGRILGASAKNAGRMGERQNRREYFAFIPKAGSNTPPFRARLLIL